MESYSNQKDIERMEHFYHGVDQNQLVLPMVILKYPGSSYEENEVGTPLDHVLSLLKIAYPMFNLKGWLFKSSLVSIHYWSEHSIQLFLTQLGLDLMIKNISDWYNANSQTFLEECPSLLKKFNYSMITLITSQLPQFVFQPWLFKNAPRYFWQSESNQLSFLDWVCTRERYTQFSDCYICTSKKMLSYGGDGLLDKYNGSFMSVLQALYPMFTWMPWKFSKSPFLFTEKQANKWRLIKFCSEKLKISDWNDWYRISRGQLLKLGVFHVIRKLGGLEDLLKEFFPYHPWDSRLLTFQGKKAGQRYLLRSLCEIFPNHRIYEEYSHPTLKFPSKRPITLDVYIPQLNLAFEYQGIQHYQDTSFFGKTQTRKTRDDTKLKICADHNLQIIDIPYWWPGDKDFLLDELKKRNIKV
uniref:Uncharacterized protein n=1 Tax=Arcella intermedia TaxID=1963864 RepID=A0A6B2L4U2_9EUKA